MNDDYTVVDDGRAGESPLRAWDAVETGIQNAEIFFPEQLAIQVESEQSFRAEEDDQMLAIGRRSGIGMGGFRVPLDFRLAG